MKKHDLKVGDCVYVREYLYTQFPDVEKHRIENIVTLGDGTTIVIHRRRTIFPFLDKIFQIEQCTEIDLFLKNSQKI